MSHKKASPDDKDQEPLILFEGGKIWVFGNKLNEIKAPKCVEAVSAEDGLKSIQ